MIPLSAGRLAGWAHVALRHGKLARGRLRKPLPEDLLGRRLRSRLAPSLRVAKVGIRRRLGAGTVSISAVEPAPMQTLLLRKNDT